MDYKKTTIEDLSKGLSEGTWSTKSLTEKAKEVIQNEDSEVHGLISFFEDIDEQVKNSEQSNSNSLIKGLPLVVKDNILYKGQLCSAASKMLENYHATYDSFVITELKKQGAIIIGRSNMDEFAMGASTEYSYYGATRNPLDTTRVPGGTSGGSAALVALGAVPFALGTDTAGSIRQPASFCGVVGMKPTYGAVSRYGIIAMGSSLDQVGPITRSVKDSETVFDAISAYDPRDAMCRPIEFREKIIRKQKAKKIGVPWKFMDSPAIDKSVLDNFKESLTKLEEMGYEIVPVDLPHIHYSLPVYYIICPAEVSTNLARFDGIRFGYRVEDKDLLASYLKSRDAFGDEAKRRILIGTYVLSAGYYDAYYNKATMLRNLITKEIKEIFESVDLIATPTTPTEAFKIGEVSDPVQMYLADLFTVPANITGVPAISIPSGVGSNGMPLGLQLMAPHFNEQYLFQVGKDFEKK